MFKLITDAMSREAVMTVQYRFTSRQTVFPLLLRPRQYPLSVIGKNAYPSLSARMFGTHSIALPLASTLLLLWLLVHLVNSFRFHKKYNFPNLVPGVPILGNLLDIPKDIAARRLYLHKLAQKYGEMYKEALSISKSRAMEAEADYPFTPSYTLKMGSNYWVFMNSHRVASEILDKRGAKYISREKLPMPGDVASGGKRVVFMPYGDLWKWERKVMHEIIGPGNRDVFAPLQDTESRALLYQYLTEPDRWNHVNARYASSLIMNLVYGRRTNLGDPNVNRIIETNNEIMKMFEPGSSWIDSFPFLANIPLPKSIQPWRWWGDSVYRASLK